MAKSADQNRPELVPEWAKALLQRFDSLEESVGRVERAVADLGGAVRSLERACNYSASGIPNRTVVRRRLVTPYADDRDPGRRNGGPTSPSAQ